VTISSFGNSLQQVAQSVNDQVNYDAVLIRIDRVCGPRTTPDQFRRIVITSGAAHHILQAAPRFEMEEETQIKLCQFMISVARTPANRMALVKMRAIQVLAAAMARHARRANLQDRGCRALWNIAHNDRTAQVHVVQSGGLNAILGAMKLHGGSDLVQAAACGALANLSANEGNSSTENGRNANARPTLPGTIRDLSDKFAQLRSTAKQNATKTDKILTLPVERTSPRWQKDTDVKLCPGTTCGGKRFIQRRGSVRDMVDFTGEYKHHCRVCGLVYCDKCTDKIEVPWKAELGLIRCCTTCYADLNSHYEKMQIQRIRDGHKATKPAVVRAHEMLTESMHLLRNDLRAAQALEGILVAQHLWLPPMQVLEGQIRAEPFLEMVFHPGNADPALFENQRWKIGSGFKSDYLVNGEPGRWSNRACTAWCWQLNPMGLHVDFSVPGCDPEGWVYGPDFAAFRQVGHDHKKKMTSVVRRRKLYRKQAFGAMAEGRKPMSDLQQKVLELLQGVVLRSQDNEKHIKWVLNAKVMEAMKEAQSSTAKMAAKGLVLRLQSMKEDVRLITALRKLADTHVSHLEDELQMVRQRQHTVGRRTSILRAESSEMSESDGEAESGFDMLDAEIEGVGANDTFNTNFSRERSESKYHRTSVTMTTN
jgi:hypothetical protein